jgi:hypothetical protein
MKNITKNASAVENLNMPSSVTLNKVPLRAIMFLNGVSTEPEIRARLEKVGYTRVVHEHGLALLAKLTGYSPVVDPPPPNAAKNAVAEIEEWQGPGFVRARAALHANFPAQEQFVFADGLIACKGAEAVLAIATFLDRCQTLKNGRKRKRMRKADQAALELLAERGIDDATLAQLRKLVVLANTPVEGPTAPEGAPSDDRTAALFELYRWVTDWSDTTRVVITRRDHQIKLGIARRRSKKVKAQPASAPAAPPAPVEEVAPPSQAA